MDDKVIVIGAVNVDFIATVDDRPLGGQTVLATDLTRRAGGKGANQAAAAARAGASTTFVGAVGDDQNGVEQLDELQLLGVNVDSVRRIPGMETGFAFITVTPDGENSIVVVSGANGELEPADAVDALFGVQTGTLVVLQTEIDAAVVDAAARTCSERDARVVLNDGPVARLAESTLALADPIVVNEHEARELCRGVAITSDRDLAKIVRAVTRARSVVVTLGAEGVLLASQTEDAFVEAVAASEVVDTTGAGDTFVGTLAAGLARGEELVTAIRAAVGAASAAVTWLGARPPRE